MDFVALDVETANADRASICQIGLVRFESGQPVDSWVSLIDPRDYFDGINVSIHGIDAATVRGSPTFQQVAGVLNQWLAGQVIATHTAFDRGAMALAAARHSVELPQCHWLDTACVARRTWPDVSQSGYGLAALAKRLGIVFKHHDALEDARAAGLILMQASLATGLNVGGWLDRVRRPINPDQSVSVSVAAKGSPEGLFFGEVLVFTGALAIPRWQAAALAIRAGCNTADGVTKHTTLLVVGDNDIRLLNGHTKSAKHRKAEGLIAKGRPIRILSESDFLAMVDELE